MREKIPQAAKPGQFVGTLSFRRYDGRIMSKPITGKFHITHMDMWDQDFVDAEVPGFISFDKHGQGEFQFGYVTGQMDCEQTELDGRPAVEWSWERCNEGRA